MYHFRVVFSQSCGLAVVTSCRDVCEYDCVSSRLSWSSFPHNIPFQSFALSMRRIELQCTNGLAPSPMIESRSLVELPVRCRTRSAGCRTFPTSFGKYGHRRRKEKIEEKKRRKSKSLNPKKSRRKWPKRRWFPEARRVLLHEKYVHPPGAA
ncbi:hypothetical protein BO82DRAFT_1996 [Aspergillus uvarum CBS 121591]|uniref:Uncharacterized protein n=1 Tax=Aspergillus uvarum CBS 121591 TaxID=1448315 RepID=A0A319D7V4_9EURO|nr:hypothetical protein BO82DRAFT_1996 [Aspergillus uvarum CBS 121591]PYH87063.1 hypothetical protein BO82DRAFT_1996 [Aspergillus uvarum CBS 121591]